MGKAGSLTSVRETHINFFFLPKKAQFTPLIGFNVSTEERKDFFHMGCVVLLLLV